MVEIIDASRNLFETKYPESEFHVIYWGPQADIREEMVSQLRVKNIPVHFVREIIPDYEANEWKYRLHERDPHPTKTAYSLVAEYISRNIIGNATSSDF